MKTIIDVPKEDYEYIKNNNDMNFNAIKNGIPLSEELEKIKSEDIDCQYEEDYEYSGGLQKAIEIIDKRISELQSKKKSDCRDCKFYDHELDEKVGTDACYGCRDYNCFKLKGE